MDICPEKWTSVHTTGFDARRERVVADCPDEDLIRKSVAALNAGDVEGYLAGFSGDSLRWVSGLDTPL